MNKHGSPSNLWFLCHQYLCDIHNMCANPNNNWKIPNQVSGGDTQDISHILQFVWFEPILFLDPTSKFPETKEKPGYFVGFARNSGDALTFKVLLPDMKTVIIRSVVRPAKDPRHRNKRVTFKDEIEEDMQKLEMPLFTNEDKHQNTPDDDGED